MEKRREVDVRLGLTISGVIVLTMLALSAYAWYQLPADVSIPIHWGINGEADGFAGKPLALLVIPAVTAIISALLAVVPLVEPRKSHLGRSEKAYLICWIGSLLMEFIAHVCIVLTALSVNVPVMQVICGSIAILFMVLGNYMGKVRSNYHFGVRTPWTLESEYSWGKTHRLSGWLFFFTGLATLLVCPLAPGPVIIYVMLGGTLVTVAASVIYSYLMWKQDPQRKSDESNRDPRLS
ncbi:MAG: SdpI family protein [Candidatus Obscuribacterales bacterium]|nr:SdpI family protein [Cyanobacteria bacterium HKST-UBA01]MCB9469873.1 SdpI family protein [Candidatus Obscuribacterales bacterium]